MLIRPEFNYVDQSDAAASPELRVPMNPAEVIRTNPVAKHTFDEFKWLYYGDPGSPDDLVRVVREHPEVGLVDYKTELYTGFGEDTGTLVQVRQCLWLDHPTAGYFIATADLYDGTITEWNVKQATSLWKNNELKTLLTLVAFIAHTPAKRQILLTHSKCRLITDRDNYENLPAFHELVNEVSKPIKFGQVALREVA